MFVMAFAASCGSDGGEDDGACEPACTAGFTCVEGDCVAATEVCDPECPAGQECKNGVCVAETPGCDPACGEGFECQNGACVALTPECVPECGQGMVCENGACVPDATGCDPACGEGFECENGACVPVATGCDPACGEGFECQNDACVPVATGCDPACQDGWECQDGQCVEIVVGCDPACQDGWECQDGQCVEIVVECDPACQQGWECQNGECVEIVVPSTGVVINEFVATPTDQEAVELLNSGANAVDLTGWTYNWQTDAEVKTWGLPAQEIAGGAFLVIDINNLTDLGGGSALIPNNGATMWIADGDGATKDEVAYGTKGAAPTPIYATSTARVKDGVDNDDNAGDFNWDATPTLGASNDVNGVALGSNEIRISEVYMNAEDDAADFFEYEVMADAALDITGWTIVLSAGGGDDYVIENGLMQPGLVAFEQAEFPEYASELNVTGVIYLYDASGVRRYQMGWDGLAEDGSSSLGYAPGDTGAADCYDTATCNLSVLTPTKGTENQL